MKNLQMSIFLFFILVGFAIVSIAMPYEPFVLLMQAKGTVEYGRSDEAMREAHRNTWLCEGHRVKTGTDGSCRLLNDIYDTIQTMESDSEVEIEKNGIRLIRGKLTNEGTSINIIGNLWRKFAMVQKYTTTHRSPVKQKKISEPAKTITLSDNYPDLVWENIEPNYAYQLKIDQRTFQVPATSDDSVRFKLTGIQPGTYSYSIDVIENGKLKYEQKIQSQLKWLSADEEAEMKKEIEISQKVTSDEPFLLANYLDEQGLRVAAMDQYQALLEKNPKASDVRMFLIGIYHALDLKQLKAKQLELYYEQEEF